MIPTPKPKPEPKPKPKPNPNPNPKPNPKPKPKPKPNQEPLSFAVLDTLRRCLVILLCGFLLHGNPAGAPQVAGALLTLGGAAWYNLATARAGRGRAPPSASDPSLPHGALPMPRASRTLVATLRSGSRLGEGRVKAG